eukprot:720401-Pleurochrysis_carterae.AAC.7
MLVAAAGRCCCRAVALNLTSSFLEASVVNNKRKVLRAEQPVHAQPGRTCARKLGAWLPERLDPEMAAFSPHLR